MSILFCDSNCELDYKIIDEFNLQVIKMPYTVDGVEDAYNLGRDPKQIEEFFEKMRNKAVVKTQGLNQMNYVEYFEPFLQKGEDILYLTFSHVLSGTFTSMKLAIDELKEKYPDRTIKFVDTKRISMAAGIVVYAAAKLHKSGATDDEIIDFVNEFQAKVSTYFTVGDLQYLRRGGRVSSVKAFVAGILNIKPMLYISPDGRLEQFSTAKGRKKSLLTLASYIDVDKLDKSYPLTIIDADCAGDAQFLEDYLRETYEGIEVWRVAIGPVIGAHSGPDTVGLIFVSK